MAVVLDGVTELATSVDVLCRADPEQLADGQTLQELYRQLDRLSAAATRATAAYDNGRPACRYHNRRRDQRRGPPG